MKARLAIDVILGIDTDVRFVQLLKAYPPIDVTLGIDKVFNPEHPLKAWSAIVVTPGIITDLRFEQPENALDARVVTLAGNVMEVQLVKAVTRGSVDGISCAKVAMHCPTVALYSLLSIVPIAERLIVALVLVV